MLGDLYAAALINADLQYDVLFGPAYKGIPLVATTAVALARQDIDTPWCFNRKEAKDHGEGGQLVGAPLQGRVVIVDDVITAGTAIRESATIIKANGAELVGVVVSLDRQERGQNHLSAVQEVEQNLGIPVICVATLQSLIAYITETGAHAEHLAALQDYRRQYGVS